MTTDMNIVTAQRLQALANGWTPLQNHDKRCFLKGWPTVEVTAELIESWRRQRRDVATGFRIEKGLAVIDLDIDDKETIDEIADAIFEIVPVLADPNKPLLVRRGKGAKEAWFVRTDELFSRIHSRSWLKPGASADAGAHRVEIFGGASPRQFGGLGPHTVQDDGVATVWYSWVDRSPLDTQQSELPLLTKKQFFAIGDAVERILRSRGWTLVERSAAGESETTRVYDLSDGMSFDIDTGERLSLHELRDRAAALGRDEPAIRCSASWLDPSSKNRTRCIVSLTRSGHLAIWETASSVTHVEAAGKPREYAIDLDRLAEQLKEMQQKRLAKISSADNATTVATKLLATYAYCPYQKECVVPLWAQSGDEGMTMQSFRTLMLPYCDEDVGPRGGRVVINPVDIWAGSSQRVSVAGLRMRPDQPRPTFTDEHGRTWVNTYRPPAHPQEGGEIGPGLELLAQLAPDAGERKYLTQWLAHKYRYPHIPGPAIIHVAHGKFGTGRGTFAELLRRLFGSSYVREMPYSMVAGRTYQSQYTDWAADKLVIFVAESAESEAGGSYQAKRDTYEHLKTLIEPNMVERTFITKGKNAFTAMACAGFFIATNHADALPVQGGDRRFTAILAGEPQPPEYWQGIRAWMDDPLNVGAFARHLLEVGLSDYDPYMAPPMTAAKRAMIEMARSDLDRAFDLVIEALPSDVLVLDQLIAGVRQANRTYSLDLPDRWTSVIKKMAIARLHRVGVPDSTNWQIKVESRKYGVYAKTRQAATYWRERDGLREEVLKNGSPAATDLPGNVLVGLFRGPGT